MFWINVSWNKPFWSTFAPSYPYGKYYISDHLYSRLCSLKCCLLVLAVPKDCLEGALNRTLQSLSVLYHVSSANGKDLVPLGAHDTLSCTFFRNQWTTFYIFHFAHLCWDVGYFANQLYFEIKQNNIHLTLPFGVLCTLDCCPTQQRCSLPIHPAKRTPRCIEFPENGLNSVMILGCRKCRNLNLKLWDVKEWSIYHS